MRVRRGEPDQDNRESSQCQMRSDAWKHSVTSFTRMSWAIDLLIEIVWLAAENASKMGSDLRPPTLIIFWA
jgi:hypothetical protein